MNDEGDRVAQDDSLGQRLAKVVKRGAQGPAADFEIASKIFETVDCKAAEPKTRPGSQKGVARARQLFAEVLKMTPEERRILESPHEILLVHTADGRLKSATLGGHHEVTIPDDIPPGAIISHNHPSGRGPSASDLKFVLLNPGVTLRIVALNEHAKKEVFSLKALAQSTEYVMNMVMVQYREECEKQGDTHQARRESLALILRIYGVIIEAAVSNIQ